MSNFVVSARKYRPQRFEDVVGQQHVAGTLKNALATDHVAHAFLFTGPRGVGKTTCARILAKILNCENRTPDFEACNECPSCRAFNESASFNIIELDAASNNSVEHIRALTEQVRFQPQQGRYKVFIIDEVHMLSNQAFNAFLKTLEEPPPYAIFILATTEKHKIIPTILSRCQIFDFRRITVADMVAHLQAICQKEGIAAEADALHIIAQKADGALRDALSIFDRITSSAGKNIRYADVIENLNVLDYDYYFQITDALLAEDAAAIFNLFDQILRQGFDPEVFLSGLAEHLRNILVCRDAATLALLEAGDSLRERYRKQAALAPASFLLTALSLANDCDVNFKTARNKRLHLEIALLKMCYINRATKAAQTVFSEKKTLDATERGVRGEGGGPSANGNGQYRPPSSNGPAQVAEPGNARSVPVPPELLSTDADPEQRVPSSSQRPPLVAPNAHELGSSELAALRTGLRQGLKKSENIPLSLDAYEQAVAEEEARKSAQESRLSIENARAEWAAYAAAHESNLVRIALSNAALRLEGKRLTATVGSTIDRSHLQGEVSRLLDALRRRLHDPALLIEIALDEAKSAEQTAPKVQRPLTKQEKLERMKEANPAVEDLIRRFDLKLDD
jgi:DNA polymerase III subunit gamma/tau